MINEISIVIGSWGSYNACNKRALGSKWLNLSDFDSWDEIEEELKKEGFILDGIDAELFIQDIDGFPCRHCNWAIKKTNNYKNFQPKLPKTIEFDVGMFVLNGRVDNPVLCFFNSLFTISNNTNLEKELINALKTKDNFYLVCDYTINSNYHMPKEEQDFIDKLLRKLKGIFKFKRFEILDGKGIIIVGEK